MDIFVDVRADIQHVKNCGGHHSLQAVRAYSRSERITAAEFGKRGGSGFLWNQADFLRIRGEVTERG